MKTMKKLFSIVLVLALVLSLGISAMANTVENEPLTKDKVEVTINQRDPGHPHTYKAYQIFSGTQNAKADADQPLADVEWGNGINAEKFVEALVEASRNEEDPLSKLFDYTYNDNEKRYETTNEKVPVTAEVVAKVIESLNEETDKLDQIAIIASKNVNKDHAITLETGTEKVDPGYYVIIDTTEVGVDDAYNKIILQVTQNVTINPKYDVPTPEKKVLDNNDTESVPVTVNPGPTNDLYQDSADHDIGDIVWFKLSATLPRDLKTDYDKYTLIFHDQESTGLLFQQGTIKVYYKNPDGELTDIDSSKYTLKTADFEDDCTFEVIFNDVKTAITDIENSATIYVVYGSILDTNAVIGKEGNPNELHLEYSNRGKEKGTGTSHEEKVVVFTYDLDVNKITKDEDGTAHPLQGAEFRMFKKVTEGYKEWDKKTGEEKDPTFFYVNSETGDIKSEAADGYERCVEVTLETSKGDTEDKKGTIFTGKGVDNGNYILVETNAPDGYNKIPPVEFTIDSKHSKDGITSVTGDPFTFTPDYASATYGGGAAMGQANIENNEGLELPETGGIGTTILYVVGGVLVAVAVIFLITKKRMGKAQR